MSNYVYNPQVNIIKQHRKSQNKHCQVNCFSDCVGHKYKVENVEHKMSLIHVPSYSFIYLDSQETFTHRFQCQPVVNK